MSTRRAVLLLLFWLVISFIPSLTGIAFGPGDWYAQLNKPAWTPPNWLFGPAWTTLYTLMAIAAWLISLRPASPARRTALIAFFVQLILNALWTPAFFGLRSPAMGLVVIVPLWLAILATIILFWRVRPVAAALLIPYILWVTYATALNFALWQLN
jgi:translocator protein